MRWIDGDPAFEKSTTDRKAIPQSEWDEPTKKDVRTLIDLCKKLGVDLEISLASGQWERGLAFGQPTARNSG